MKTDSSDPVPTDNEVRVTALLLGELSPDESAEVLAQLQAKPELALLYERLRQTLGLLVEATAMPEKADPVTQPAHRFSDRRRDVLLSLFKSVPSIELERMAGRGSVPWLRIAALLAFLGIVAALTLPNFVKARPTRYASLVLTNKLALESGNELPKVTAATKTPAPEAPWGASVAKLELHAERGAVAQVLPGATTLSMADASEQPPSPRLEPSTMRRYGLAEGVRPAESKTRYLRRDSDPAAPQGGPPPAPASPIPAQAFSFFKPLEQDASGLGGRGETRDPSEAQVQVRRELGEASRPLALKEKSQASAGSFGDVSTSAAPEFRKRPTLLPSLKADSPKLENLDTSLAGAATANENKPVGLSVNMASVLTSRARTPAVKEDVLSRSYGRISGTSTSTDDLALARESEREVDWKSATLSQAQLGKKVTQALAVPEAKDKEMVPIVDSASAPEPQPEQFTRENAFSTFSLNVTDVSFKLAAASLAAGALPSPGAVRSEEFINALDYRDPQPSAGSPIGFAWDRARYAFGHNQDLLRFSIKTAALGREPGRPYNLVILLDNSGSMERADRVGIIHEILSALASKLRAQDRVSVVSFARTARLWVDALPGSQAGELIKKTAELTREGGTNLEEALRLGYETALRHFMPHGVNRVILLTDGAANLGEVEPEGLERQVESHRKRGVALDCFGIGWEGYNDQLLEQLSRHGDGRYGFVNSAEEASTSFVNQLAGALHVAAADVKVQVEFNPLRVPAWRQIGYAKHQLKKEQFRDNTVDAAELAAAEAGNALYVVQINQEGEGGIGVVRARFREPSTGVYRELEWMVPYNGGASPMEQSSSAMRLAGTSALLGEWLAASPFAAEVTLDKLQVWLRGVPEVFSPDPRPRQLETMLRQARSISGK